MTVVTVSEISDRHRHRPPARLWRRVRVAIAEAHRDSDLLGAQMLVACRFWHVPPSPMELEYIARAMNDRAGPVRDRL